MRKIAFSAFFLVVLVGQAWGTLWDGGNHWPLGDGKEIAFKGRFPLPAMAESTHTYDVLHYRLDLYFPMTSDYLEGRATIACRSQVEGLSSLDLDCVSLSVDTVKIDGVIAPLWQLSEGKLEIEDMGTTFSLGDSFDVEVTYHGRPAKGYYFFYASGGVPATGFTTCEPSDSRYWFPCFDRPWDKADYGSQLNATVPLGYQVASNGLLMEVDTTSTKNGDLVTYHWQETHSIATYLMSVAISKYAIINDSFFSPYGDTIPVQHFVYHPDSSKALKNFGKVPDMMGFYTSRFGDYPFSKYGMATVSGFGGGMEHQTMTTIGRFAATSGWEEGVAHELAHQWWGDMITCADWASIWLNEGFATYSEALWVEDEYGSAAMHQEMNGRANTYFRMAGNDFPIYNPPPGHLFDTARIYYKGAWVLHMLRHVVGDDNFWEILQAYYDAYKYGIATIPQFQEVCEGVYGEDLDWFFQEWIYQAGYPQYEFLWTAQGSDSGYLVDAYIRQVQEGFPLFNMPMDLDIILPDTQITERVMVDDAEEHFVFMVDSLPTDVQLDKDNWVLKEVIPITTPLLSTLGYTVDDGTGNDNGRPDPGEAVELRVEVSNRGIPALDLTGTIWTRCPYINITDAQADFDSVGVEDTVENLTDPFGFAVDSDAPSHTALIFLELNADGGYHKTDSLWVEVGPSTVLLVDDDGGADYESYYEASLSRLLPYDLWETAGQGSPGETLSHYQAVVWLTGNDSLSSLTSGEQADIAAYLEGGGNLFLSGEDIGYDLGGDGDPSDSAFYHQVLHSAYGGQVEERDMLFGASGDPIADGFVLYLNGYGGADNQRHPDVVLPLSGAVTIFKYYPSDSPESAAIRYAGSGHLVYFGFGFEALTGDTPGQSLAARTELLNSILGWFGVATEVQGRGESKPTPSGYTLLQNYPNPFNANTVIRYSLIVDRHQQSEEGGSRARATSTINVSLKVYNILGQEVRTLVDGEQASGRYSVVWDGRDGRGRRVASGVYLCRMKAPGFEQVRRLILIK